MTGRTLVEQTLDFAGPGRIPRDLWTLPWANARYPREVDSIRRRFPMDLSTAPERLATPTREHGDAYARGTFTDAWGAKFVQATDGIIGEVKEPLVTDDGWQQLDRVHIPRERLTFDRDAVNEFCRSSDTFVVSPVIARPFEQLQFIRGTENLYMDLVDMPAGLRAFLLKMHSFYCELTEAWARTDVDAIFFMDDWGAQNALLISPDLWRSVFKPLYRDYITIAHRHNKRAFMHSDGHITAIYPDLIEMGLDAINSQLFCMGVDRLEQFAGSITFWGEVDRQRLLVDASPREVEEAVGHVYRALFRDGGCIAQCEFGAGARPENVSAVFEAWQNVHRA